MYVHTHFTNRTGWYRERRHSLALNWIARRSIWKERFAEGSTGVFSPFRRFRVHERATRPARINSNRGQISHTTGRAIAHGTGGVWRLFPLRCSRYTMLFQAMISRKRGTDLSIPSVRYAAISQWGYKHTLNLRARITLKIICLHI